MKIIYDTNTVSYAYNGEKLYSFFMFKNHTIFIAQKLLKEEMKKYQKELEDLELHGRLTVLLTSSKAWEIYYSISKKHPQGLSAKDLICLAIALAESLDAIATADHQLRAAAQAEGCQPLWMLDLVGFLLDEKIFTKDEAREFYAKAYKGSERKFQSAIDEQLARY